MRAAAGTKLYDGRQFLLHLLLLIRCPYPKSTRWVMLLLVLLVLLLSFLLKSFLSMIMMLPLQLLVLVSQRSLL